MKKVITTLLLLLTLFTSAGAESLTLSAPDSVSLPVGESTTVNILVPYGAGVHFALSVIDTPNILKVQWGDSYRSGNDVIIPLLISAKEPGQCDLAIFFTTQEPMTIHISVTVTDKESMPVLSKIGLGVMIIGIIGLIKSIITNMKESSNKPVYESDTSSDHSAPVFTPSPCTELISNTSRYDLYARFFGAVQSMREPNGTGSVRVSLNEDGTIRVECHYCNYECYDCHHRLGVSLLQPGLYVTGDGDAFSYTLERVTFSASEFGTSTIIRALMNSVSDAKVTSQTERADFCSVQFQT